MSKGRLEAFSDGVLAIVITIMVLELKPPHSTDWEEIRALAFVLLGYLLSFVFVGIYWNNHHHLLQAVRQINGSVLWANLHLLFWLSLIPFVTRWMDESFVSMSVAAYGVVLLMAGFAYLILAQTLIRLHGNESTIARALGRDVKGKISVLIYVAAIPLAFVDARIACGLYVIVALIWLFPDPRIESVLKNHQVGIDAEHGGAPPTGTG